VGAFLDALRSAKNGAENARDSVHDLVKHTGNLIDNGRDASEDLTDFALKQHDYRGSIDNVTVVVLFTQH
jgi:hypothetical protein